MGNELYNKYYGILAHINNIMNITTDNKLKELSKKTIINTVEKLCNFDQKNKEVYENILVEFNIVKKVDENKVLDEITENIIEDKKEDVIDKINEDETIIEETDKNILDDNQKEEELFLKENHENEVEEELSLEENQENKNDDEYIENNNIEEDNKNNIETVEEKSNINEKYKEAEEYVLNEIYRGENVLLGDKFQNIMVNLIKGLRINDKEVVDKYTDEYYKFIDENSSIFNREILENYIKFIKFEYDNSKENQKEKKEGLKIKSIKKTFNSKIKNRALSLIALSSIGIFNPLLAAGVGAGAYYLYKKGIKNAKVIIEKNGLSIDENDNLINNNGKIITQEDIGKLKYNLITKELMKLDKSEGVIDKSYKKNKLTSLLFNFEKTFKREKITNLKNIGDKFLRTIEVNSKKTKEDVIDINKGMGLMK